MAEYLLDNLQVDALLGILINNPPDTALLPPDGVLSFTHRMVMELVNDCLTKYYQGHLTSEYLTDLPQNIRTSLQQAEERFQNGDLSFIKELAQKVLSVLEHPARSSERLETAEGDTKDGQNLHPEIFPDPNTSQRELTSDLITETPVLSNLDSGICEILEIQEPATRAIESLIPARQPHMNDFEISKLIGKGAYGTVYLARHKDSQQIFAMKKIAKWNLDTPKRVERAFQERDILTFADCPFVVSMLCSFPTKTDLCMVMEHVEGGDCGSLLRTRGHLPVPLARLYFAEAVLAVEYLHSYGVIHRDLKPENLLITSAGHIKVTDLGLSKVGVMIPKSNIYKQSSENICREFLDLEACGTLSYIAPEVILQKGYGRPVDWWSMGIILQKFLVGCLPIYGDSLIEFYKNVVSGDIVLHHSPVPPLVAQKLISELLRKNPAQRLGTGGAFEIKVHPFLNDLDFDNLLSQKPEYVPQLVSAVDTSFFINHSDMNNSEGEDNESLDFLNFTSSSKRLLKLYTNTNSMMNDEDPKSPPECTPASSINISEMQKESFPVSKRDDAKSSLSSSSPLSDHSDKNNHLVSEDKDRKHEDNDVLLKFKSSSEGLSKLCTTATGMMNDEDPKSPSECTPASNTNISEMQKEYFSVSNRDDAVSSLSSSSPLSVQEERQSAINLSNEPENIEKGKKRRGSIFRRILSSCRRRLSRAARLFACCHCCPRTN
ncbi:microtubule-associated serine/threonine-protein kinase 2-like [Ranitomeya variabilis]|uniref:microtubule-associated serine/threonine-protein kinase 2-like n=1 Tax=Ranitomeya variabilis TaxID=490064 RepID=UPI0040560E1A